MFEALDSKEDRMEQNKTGQDWRGRERRDKLKDKSRKAKLGGCCEIESEKKRRLKRERFRK